MVEENIALFEREIEILGTKPVLIALGGKVHEILTSYVDSKYEIVKVKHVRESRLLESPQWKF